MSIPRLKPGVRLHFDRVRDRWVLLAPERILALDEPARAILEKIDGTTPLADIAAQLAREYEADAGYIEADAAALLRDLSDKGHVAL